MQTYFITTRRWEFVKIGKTCNIKQRIRELQFSCPDRLYCVCILEGDREHALHKKFADLRSHGEWFIALGPIKTFVLQQTFDRPVLRIEGIDTVDFEKW